MRGLVAVSIGACLVSLAFVACDDPSGSPPSGVDAGSGVIAPEAGGTGPSPDVPAEPAEGGPPPTASNWGAPEFVSAAGVNGIFPAVAMDASGNATAVWLQDEDPTAAVQNAIWSAVRPAGGSWGAPVRVSDSDTPVESYVFDMNAKGQALVIWRRFEGSHRLRVSHRNAGGATWTPPLYLHGTDISVPFFQAGLDVGPDGVAYLAFTGRDAANDTKIFFSAHTPGTGWSGMTILSDGENTYPDDGVPSHPSIAASSAGQWQAAWATPRPGGPVIRIRGSLANGSISSVTPVSDPANAGENPFIWGDPAGGFVRAWREKSPTDGADLMRLVGLDDTSSGKGDTLVYDAPDTDGAEARSTAFFGGKATALLVMVDAANNTYMRTTSRADGATWSAPEEPLDTRKTVYDGSLAVDAAGTLTLAFRQGSPWRAMVSQLLPGTTKWTRGRALSVHVSGVVDHATSVRVAAGPAGSPIVLWQQKVDGVSRILSSHASP